MSPSFGKALLMIIHGYTDCLTASGRILKPEKFNKLTTKIVIVLEDSIDPLSLSDKDKKYILNKFAFDSGDVEIAWTNAKNRIVEFDETEWTGFRYEGGSFVWFDNSKMIDGVYSVDFNEKKPKLKVIQESSLFEPVKSQKIISVKDLLQRLFIIYLMMIPVSMAMAMSVARVGGVWLTGLAFVFYLGGILDLDSSMLDVSSFAY